MMRTGMILGKFMPPHRGHQYLIDFARERVQQLTLLVCSLEHEPISGRLRFNWVKEMYPDVRVVHLTDENPSEPHEHPDFWNLWISSIRRVLPMGPDVVFTSEPYGEELAERLGAQHIVVDQGRQLVPVSASKIREHPLEYWEFIPGCVRPYFVKRIAVVGAESTGKTTLAQQLAAHYQTVWVPEFARSYLDRKNAPCDLSDIPHIATGQAESVERLARNANRYLICDTDLITTTIWSHHYFKECPDWIAQAAAEQTYDLYLLTNIDLPWVADPQRDCPHLREFFHTWFVNELTKRNKRFALISGQNQERVKNAVQAIDSFLASV